MCVSVCHTQPHQCHQSQIPQQYSTHQTPKMGSIMVSEVRWQHCHTEVENFGKPKHCTENVTWIVFGGLHWLFLSAERVRMYELCQIKAVLIVWCCGDSVSVKCDDLWQQQPAGVSISVAGTGTGVHCDGCPAPLAHHWYTDLALALCPTQHCSHCCASFHLMWNIQMKPTGCNEYINISTQLNYTHYTLAGCLVLGTIMQILDTRYLLCHY